MLEGTFRNFVHHGLGHISYMMGGGQFIRKQAKEKHFTRYKLFLNELKYLAEEDLRIFFLSHTRNSSTRVNLPKGEMTDDYV